MSRYTIDEIAAIIGYPHFVKPYEAFLSPERPQIAWLLPFTGELVARPATLSADAIAAAAAGLEPDNPLIVQWICGLPHTPGDLPVSCLAWTNDGKTFQVLQACELHRSQIPSIDSAHRRPLERGSPSRLAVALPTSSDELARVLGATARVASILPSSSTSRFGINSFEAHGPLDASTACALEESCTRFLEPGGEVLFFWDCESAESRGERCAAVFNGTRWILVNVCPRLASDFGATE